jgi:hypothetical protein
MSAGTHGRGAELGAVAIAIPRSGEPARERAGRWLAPVPDPEPLTPELVLVGSEADRALARALLPVLDPDGWMPRTPLHPVVALRARAEAAAPAEDRRAPERRGGLLESLLALVRWSFVAIGVAFVATLALTSLGGNDDPVVAPPRQVEPTSLSWPADERAGYYHVQLHRGGEKVYDAWLTGTTLRLPERWRHGGRERRLEPGPYRYYVWPGYGRRAEARYGAPVGEGVVVVPPAA